MQANELRLGNCVEDEVLGNCKVYSINNKQIQVIVNNVNTDGSLSKRVFGLDIDCIKPIPITGEWIRKHTEYESMRELAIDFDELVNLKTGMYLLIYTDQGIEYFCNLPVHRLQNIYFALTQKELIIK
jgi:hypothetical protein